MASSGRSIIRADARAAALALLLVGMVGAVQGQAVRVDDDVPLRIGLPERSLIEPHVVVHPNNPAHILGATMVTSGAPTFTERQLQQSCATFVSTDHGASWRRHDFAALSWCGDPWVAITPGGHAVFTALAAHADFPHAPRGGLLVYHSSDGGITWDEKPVSLGRGHDHQTVVVDRSLDARADWLYVVSSRNFRGDHGMLRFSVEVARSRNGGLAFDPSTAIRPNNLLIKAETPVVLSDGTVLVSFVEAAENDGRSVLLRRRAWVVRSMDGGHTFSRPMFVNEACGPPDTFSLSALVADVAIGPFLDRLYFACNKPGMRGVVLNYSADMGESWSDPVEVHPQSPDSLVHRHLMSTAVNPTGTVGTVWADGRHQPAGDCYDAYFAASVDGGETFLPEQRLSTMTSCADSSATGGPLPWSHGGDYWGMAADGANGFRVVWSDARTGQFQLRTAVVTVELEGARRK